MQAAGTLLECPVSNPGVLRTQGVSVLTCATLGRARRELNQDLIAPGRAKNARAYTHAVDPNGSETQF